MESESTNPNINENIFLEMVEDAEILFEEFGALHPLTEESTKEAAGVGMYLLEKDKLSESAQRTLNKFMNRYIARREKAFEEQTLIQEKATLNRIGLAIGGLALAAGAAFLWSRSKNPKEIFHHHEGFISQNINGEITKKVSHNITGTLTENLNVNWPSNWL